MAITKVTGHVIESTTNITSHNINSSGIITATRFDGPVGSGLTDGNFSGIITSTQLNVTGVGTFNGIGVTSLNVSGVGTFTSLNVTGASTFGGNIDVDGHTELDNVRVSGVTTTAAVSWGGHMLPTSNAAYDIGSADYKVRHLFLSDSSLKFVDSSDNEHPLSVDSGRLKFAGGLLLGNTIKVDASSGVITATSANFSGNVTIGGTLTYEDVTNIDSVGIVTARAGIVDSTLTAGRVVYVDSDKSLTDSANLTFNGNNVTLEEGRLFVKRSTIPSVDVRNSTNTSYSRVILQQGAAEGGYFQISREGTNSTANAGANSVELNQSSNHPLTIKTNNTERLRIAGDGKIGIGNNNPGYNLDIKNGTSARVAIDVTTGSDASIIMDGINADFAGSDYYSIKAQSTGEFAIFRAASEYLRITSSGELKINHNASGVSADAGANEFSIEGGNLDIGMSFISPAANNRTQTIAFGDSANTIIGRIQYAHGDDSFRVDTGGSERLRVNASGLTVTGEVAATQDYPMIRPRIDWNFAASKTLDPRIKFTRGGVASYVDDQGIIKYASKNTPRFDHHPTTGESLGILLEKTRINVQEYSVDMDQANHKNNVTVTNEDAISPDGTQNASKIVGGGSDAATNLGWNSASVPSGQYANWSIFVKSNHSSCILQFFTNTFVGGTARMNLELADGTTGGDANSSTWRWSVTPYPNGWYRVTWGGNGAGAAGGMYVSVVDSKTAARAATCGSATSKTWYAWGIQEENNSESKTASSYIPTYGASATRGADGGVIDGEDFNAFFDRLQGTIVHEFANELQDAGMGGGSGWELNNSDFQKNVITSISSGYSHNGYPGAYAVAYGESSDSGDNNIASFGPSSAPDNGVGERHGTGDYSRFYKYYRDAMSWKVTPFFTTNILRVASGGVANQTTNTSNISFRNVSQFEFQPYGGNDMAGSYQAFSGRIRRWMYYDKLMTQSQLATMTDGCN